MLGTVHHRAAFRQSTLAAAGALGAILAGGAAGSFYGVDGVLVGAVGAFWLSPLMLLAARMLKSRPLAPAAMMVLIGPAFAGVACARHANALWSLLVICGAVGVAIGAARVLLPRVLFLAPGVCRFCGYDLQEHADMVCPECGSTRPGDGRRPIRRTQPIREHIGAVALALLLALAPGAAMSAMPGPPSPLRQGVPIWRLSVEDKLRSNDLGISWEGQRQLLRMEDVEAVRRFLHHPSDGVRLAAVRALARRAPPDVWAFGRLPHRDITPWLEDLRELASEDRNKRIREAAQDALDPYWADDD